MSRHVLFTVSRADAFSFDMSATERKIKEIETGVSKMTVLIRVIMDKLHMQKENFLPNFTQILNEFQIISELYLKQSIFLLLL